jgi:diguanylate cyclase (GGDEF)-like protein
MLLLQALSAAPSSAAPWTVADTVFTHVADDNQLPNGASPFALTEDRDGFLWEGSDDGLARYDGHGFHAYTADAGHPGGLPDSLILALHVDVRGRLWIGTGGGLARYDRDDDRFVTYLAGPLGPSSPSVAAIADDGVDALWLGTQSGLDHLDLASGRIERVRHVTGEGERMPGSAVRAILVARNGALWVATERGLFRRSQGSTRFAPVPLAVPRGKIVDVSQLLEDRTGRLWIGTSTQGAFLLAPGARIARKLHETPGAPGSDPSTDFDGERIMSIVQASPSEMWLGTVGGGIVAFDMQTLRTRRMRHDPMLPSSLLDDTVRVLYRDRAGLIWSGTDRSLSYAIAEPAISTVFGPSSRPDGLTDPNVQAILGLPAGRVWLGLGKNGIDMFGPAGTRDGALRVDPRHPATALAPGQVYALSSDAGHVYIGTAKGLYAASVDGRRVRRMNVAGRDPSSEVLTVLAEDGVVWFGGQDGFWEVRPTASGTDMLLGGPTAPQLTDPRVSAFAFDRTHALWIGTENGLNLYDPRKHTLERFLPHTGPASLSSGFIATLLTDPTGRLWVGTQGGGIDILERADAHGHARFRHIGSAAGLPSANVDMLLEDKRGHVWASTDDGLAVIDERTLAVRPLGAADGVAISGNWWRSGARTAAGDLLFGGLGGITIVRPQLLSRSAYDPPIVFTAIRVGGRSIASGRYASGGSSVPIEIVPGANSLAVGFSALEFSAPEENKFAYRLEGFDKDWTYADFARRADYTNLPPGDYTLRVRGTNREGVWMRRDVTLKIHVVPAWWQMLWFRLIVALGICVAIALLVHGRTRYLQGRQQELEREIAERTAQLLITNAELAASTVELSKSQTRLESLAYLDGLTELPNRRMFTERFESLIAQMKRSDGGRFALILIDLDHFKAINDDLGHQAGDALLVEAAIRLRESVRQSDLVARFGGDEFAMLLLDPGEWSDVDATCRRIVECFEVPIAFGEHTMRTTPSIGIATFPQGGETQDALYRAADLALYNAKRNGRNTWRWHVPEIVI